MAREPVRQIERSAQLQPVAAPVDTFVTAAQSPLRDLADAMKIISPSLEGFIEERNKKQTEEDLIRGEAAFYDDNAGELAEAVRQGKIPAHYSPNFVKGFKNAQGTVAGGQLRQKFDAAFNAWEGKNSEDPNAFDDFFKTFVAENLQTEDPDVLRGLMPSIREVQQNGRSRYMEYRHKQTYDGSLNAHAAGAMQEVDLFNQEGLTSKEGTNYDGVFTNIFAKREAFIKEGGTPADFDKAILEAMSTKIMELKDPGLLKFFDQTVPGEAYTYADTPDGLKVKNATIDQLEAEARRQIVDVGQKQKAEQERLKDAAQTGIIRYIIESPDGEIPEELIIQAEKNGDPTIRTRLGEWRKNLTNTPSDPAKLKALTEDMITDPDNAEKYLLRAMDAGVFENADDLQSAARFADSVTERGVEISRALDSSVSKTILSTIEKRTSLLDAVGDPVNGASQETLEAQFDFRRMMTQWMLDNPDAKLWEVEEQASKFGKMIFDRFTENEKDAGLEEGNFVYDRPDDVGFDNPYTNGKPTEGEDAAGDLQGLEEEEPPAPEVEDFIKQLDEGQRADLERLGSATGRDINEVVRDILAKNPTADKIAYDPNSDDLGEGDPRETGITPEQASTFIEEAFHGADSKSFTPDEQVGNLKALIRQHEAAGNYNAVYGNSKSKRDLSQYTLDEILGMQQRARRRGAASTAIGAYQFIYKTLRGLRNSLGLTGKEKFTPELQDRLADALLEGRGLSAYKAGKLSKRQFALRLSQEWASLPNPNTGRSFYAGDGLNASSAKASQVYAALGLLTTD